MHLLLILGVLRLGGLLLLVLVLLGASRLGQGTLKDLENLRVLDLLVGLELGKIGSGGSSKTGDTVLGDGCIEG